MKSSWLLKICLSVAFLCGLEVMAQNVELSEDAPEKSKKNSQSSKKQTFSIPVKIGTYNVREAKKNDSEHHWAHRKSAVISVINGMNVEVLALQDALKNQVDDIVSAADKKWAVIPGMGIKGGENGTFNPILYKKENWKVADSGVFWFSDTPQISSQSWGNAEKMFCHWVRFQEIKTGKSFYLYNIKLDRFGARAREYAAKYLCRLIVERSAEKIPSIICGDFCVGRTDAAIETLTQKPRPGVVDRLAIGLKEIYDGEKEVPNSFKSYSDEVSFRPDMIVVSDDWKIGRKIIKADRINGRQPSEHFPVCVELKWEPQVIAPVVEPKKEVKKPVAPKEDVKINKEKGKDIPMPPAEVKEKGKDIPMPPAEVEEKGKDIPMPPVEVKEKGKDIPTPPAGDKIIDSSGNEVIW